MSLCFGVSSEQPHPLDRGIDKDKYISKELTDSEGVTAEHISTLKRRAAIVKTAREREVEGLKTEIKRAEKVLSDVADRIIKIKADKQLKVLRSDLHKREDSLFMEGMRLDIALEEQIKAFASEKRFSAEVLRHFLQCQSCVLTYSPEKVW